MASLGAALATNVLGHTDAEKAFRPWWDNFEDYLIYGLITLGKWRLIFSEFLWNMKVPNK